MRSSGSPKPINTVGNPRSPANWLTTGIEPPSRMKTGGRPNVASYAWAAARIVGVFVSSSAAGEPPAKLIVAVTLGGRTART